MYCTINPKNNTPIDSANIRYKTPISLTFDDNNHLSILKVVPFRLITYRTLK